MGDDIDYSDSDDELLGITDSPVLKHSKYAINKSINLSNITNNTQQSPITQQSDDYYISNKSINTQKDPWSSVVPSSKHLIPTMEIINTRNYKQQYRPENKYQRMREISNIPGFVVNVHDATNFDVDLQISCQDHERYKDVISNQYTYQDLSQDFIENPDKNKIVDINPYTGTTYRCRLRGVGINQLPNHIHTWKSNQLCIDVKQLIDRTDGWITCTLSDIDVYQRLLVDITINTHDSSIDLRSYLLEKMKYEKYPIFSPYLGKKDRNYIMHA